MAINSRSRIPLAALNLIALAALSLAPLSSSAMGSKPPTQSETPATKQPSTAGTGRTVVWHDGSQERTLWRDERLVAEFAAPASTRSAVKAAIPTAKQRTIKHGAVRVWELAEDSAAALDAIRGANPQARVSPVFRDSESGGRLRALPGNVIVHLDPSWDDARAQDWARAQGVEILKKLTFGNNIYLIKTDAGLAALETANKLRTTAGVVRATPDWWEEVTTR